MSDHCVGYRPALSRPSGQALHPAGYGQNDKKGLRLTVTLLEILLLLSFLLAGCGSDEEVAGDQGTDAVTGSTAGQGTLQAAQPPAAERPTPTASAETGTGIAGAEATDPGPEIGEITFALGITPAYEPVDESLFFSHGITELHAIFTYSGLAPDDTWERVWYLNDQEIGRALEPWNGPAAGVFDYVVDNGGKPLPAGDWVLELYVGGELQTMGVFIIEDAP